MAKQRSSEEKLQGRHICKRSFRLKVLLLTLQHGLRRGDQSPSVVSIKRVPISFDLENAFKEIQRNGWDILTVLLSNRRFSSSRPKLHTNPLGLDPPQSALDAMPHFSLIVPSNLIAQLFKRPLAERGAAIDLSRVLSRVWARQLAITAASEATWYGHEVHVPVPRNGRLPCADG